MHAQVGAAMDNGVGALTFGVELAGGRVTWPSGPTWLLYGGDDSHCMESMPVLLRKGTFCSSFVAQARVFRTYHSWVLSMMLRRVCPAVNLANVAILGLLPTS